MKLTLFLGGLLAFALASWPPVVRAQGSVVETQMEVTTALVQSQLTIEAIKKADDARTRALATQRDALAVQVRTGKAQMAALVAANEALLTQLATTSDDYKLEIALFRGTVTDIASTQEGERALALYNVDPQSGLALLDRLQAAEETAHHEAIEKREAIEDAVGERHNAQLANDALARGAPGVSTASVISRYEAVVKLDPSVTSDWIQLSRLYESTRQWPDALRAADASLSAARGVFERQAAFNQVGDVRVDQGDLSDASKAYEQANPWGAISGDAYAEQSEMLTEQGVMGYYLQRFYDARRAARAAPTLAVLQRDFATSMAKLAFHFGVVRWSEVVTQLTSMREQGMLDPSDEHFLQDAQVFANRQQPLPPGGPAKTQ
jgi:tetratricopeptide (TPR) repeat protein